MTEEDLLRLAIEIDAGQLKKEQADINALMGRSADVFELATKAVEDAEGTYEVLAAAATRATQPVHALATEGAEVNAVLADLARQETSLIAPVNAASAALDREDAEVNQLLGSLKKQEAALDRAAKGHAAVDKAAVKAGGGVAGLGQSMLQSGRIIQDFAQGGLGGILNNFESFAMAVGLGPGAAGAATALGVAVYLAGPKIVEFGSQFVPVNDHAESLKGTLERLTERVEELKGKEIRLPVEQRELDDALAKLKKLQEGQAAWEAAHQTRSSAEKQSGQEVAETLAENAEGESAVVDAVTANMIKRANENSDVLREVRQRIARFEQGAASASNEFEKKTWLQWLQQEKDKAQGVKDSIEKETRDTFGIILKEAKEGAARQQARLAQELRAAGKGDLAAAIEEVSPEKVQAANDEETQARIEGEKAQAARERRARAKELDDQRSRELNEMGADIEKQTRAENPDLFKNPVLAGRSAAKAETAAQARAGKKEADQLTAEAKANLGRIEAEAKRIEGRLGGATQGQYELAQASNASAVARGSPVARSTAEERRFRQQGGVLGRDYALPQEEMDRRLRREMATDFRRRGASEQGANLAASHIGERGDSELARLQSQGLDAHQVTQHVVSEMQGAQAKILGRLQGVEAANRQLMNNARQLNQRADSMGMSGLNSGRSS